MADNLTPTEVRRARGLARYAQHCETCGGRYDQTPEGRKCGAGCKIKRTAVVPTGPYTKWEKKRMVTNGE